MSDKSRTSIPAANIRDTDLAALAQTNPDTAREIARLRELMNRGEETTEEFLRLCQLLFDIGSVAASEYLLRRNVDDEEGYALYVQLFGTARQEEFEEAIERFEEQFHVKLTLMARKQFLLVATFRSPGGTTQSGGLTLVSRSCEITFGYVERDWIEAEVSVISDRETPQADECLLLFFRNGIWEIVDPVETEAV